MSLGMMVSICSAQGVARLGGVALLEEVTEGGFESFKCSSQVPGHPFPVDPDPDADAEACLLQLGGMNMESMEKKQKMTAAGIHSRAYNAAHKASAAIGDPLQG